MILSIEGPEATTKTTIAYTGPLPIVGFSFDLGTERAIYGTMYDKFFKGLDIKLINYMDKWDGKYGDITVFEMPQPVQLDQNMLKGFMEQWSFFINHLNDAVVKQGVPTVVVDTMTLARRIKADAYLQELQENNPSRPRKQLLQIEYGHANDSIKNIYTLMAGMRRNLIAIHHQTDERKDGVDKDGAVVSMMTGNKVLEGLNNTYRYVDVALVTSKGKDGIVGKMQKCGYNLSLEGNPISNPNWDNITGMISMSLGDRIKFDKRNAE